MELLEAVPGTLILKNLDSNRHLAIPVDFVEIVPGTDGSIPRGRIMVNIYDVNPAFISYVR